MEEEEENNSFLHQVQEDSITEGKLLNMAANSKPLAEDNTTEQVKGEPSVSVQGDEHDEAADQEIHTPDTEIKTELSDIRVCSPASAQIGTEDCALDIEAPSILEPVPPKDEEELELVQDSVSGDAEPSISAVNHDGVSGEDDETPIDLKLEEESPRSPKLDEKTPELDHGKEDEEETPSGVKLDEEEVFFSTEKEEEETLADLGEKNHKEEAQISEDSKLENESVARMDDTKEEEDIPVDPQIEEETTAEQKMEEEDTESEDVGKESGDDSTVLGGDEDEDEAVAAEEEAETALETEADGVDLGKESGGGKRKRGKNPKGTSKVTTGTRKKTSEEDVCFICFDGGELVLCDRRGCPKAYHPTCVNRDEAFFKAKGRWNCV